MTVNPTHRFPNDPLLAKLLVAVAQSITSDPIIHDVRGFDKTYSELLHDTIQTRFRLYSQLPPEIFDDSGILHKEQQNVCILTRGGYEFLVAFFAVRAIGGVCVPLASGVLPEEAFYFVSKVKSISLLASNERMERAAEIHNFVNQSQTTEFYPPVSIQSNGKPSGKVRVEIDDTLQMAENEPGFVLFTSGTTGQPKGVLLPRRCLTDFPYSEKCRTCVSYRPPHWIGGMCSLVATLVAGRRLHILGEKANAADLVDAFKNHEINEVSLSPLWLRQMQDLLTNGTGELAEEEKEKCAGYFKGLSSLRCTAAIIAPLTKQFWTDLTGLPFVNIYASTELGGLGTRGTPILKGSIGTQPPYIKVKLSQGTHGEILVKSPNMFLGYVDDEKKTQEAFDEEGYFKTGDLGEFRDGEYLFAGRENNDYVCYSSYRFPTTEVETCLASLPYIAEAVVLAVPNDRAKHVCGAIVRLKPCDTSEPVTLDRIHSDLSDILAPYMLPILLRVLSDGEELPYTVSGKPIKRHILKDYFGSTDGFPPQEMPPRVERCIPQKISGVEGKAWDWSGMQLAT